MDTTATFKPARNTRAFVSHFGNSLGNFMRRLFDILASIFGLFLLSPFFLLIAMLIKRDSAGPVFFRGLRVGRNGREFGILKFRTMYEQPASYEGPCLTNSTDGRVTPFGRWLRDTKMNELPQLWNVLVGDMSLVGPRPEDPTIAAQWPEETRREILSVRPGMTSPASIIFREEEGLLSSNNLMEDYLKKVLPSKLRLDVLYLRRRNLLNDLDVIFLTFMALLPRLRRKSIPENTLYYGPLNQFFSRFMNWFIIDGVISLAAVTVSGIVWRLSAPLNLGIWHSLVIALLVALAFSLCNLAMGINRIAWRSARAEAAVDLGLSAGFTSLILIVANHINWLPVRLPLGMLMMIGTLSFFGFVAARYRERILTGIASRWLAIRHEAPALGERVLIVGAGEMGGLVSWLVKHGEFARVFSVVGYVDDDPRKTDMMIDGSPVLGIAADLPALIKKYDAGLVIYAISNIDAEQRRRILTICAQAAVQVVEFPNVLERMKSSFLSETDQPAGWIERRELAGMLSEIDSLLEKGDLTLARARLLELQDQFAVAETV